MSSELHTAAVTHQQTVTFDDLVRIADVLRKMPGIEVAKSGEIRYNGQPINNFYIEGLDMLDGRYGQATNNIAPQDVASVEVMENHQPIKALKDIVFSDRAAINLRLKPHAKARWTGTLRGGAGWSPALWNGALFAMRIGARGQSMVNLKTDNTGQNPSAETERLSVEDILNGEYVPLLNAIYDCKLPTLAAVNGAAHAASSVAALLPGFIPDGLRRPPRPLSA